MFKPFKELLSEVKAVKWYVIDVGIEKRIGTSEAFELKYDRDNFTVQAKSRVEAVAAVKYLIDDWKNIYEGETAFVAGVRVKK